MYIGDGIPTPDQNVMTSRGVEEKPRALYLGLSIRLLSRLLVRLTVLTGLGAVRATCSGLVPYPSCREL